MVANRQNTGALRREAKRPLRERLYWLPRVFSLVLLVVALMGAGWGLEKLYERLNVAIGVIAIKGEFAQVDQAEIQQLVEPLVSGGFLSLNLQTIRRELELHPWVQQARVSRRWPDELVITVSEEVPIARWGDTGFLNVRGERRDIGDNSALAFLPKLQGGDQSERHLMKSYREMVQLLQPSGLRIATLKRDDRGAWWLRLDNDLELVIGRDQVMEKMRRFLEVWEQVLKEKSDQIARVDIRYDNGVAVQWVTQQGHAGGLAEQKLTSISGSTEKV
ncbi:MAG: FtsQ-type POTRA domain-containing protein [Gammaproteobacteria bacterium]|nr:MAG: FtsQ-type POTRA domain-containing protein [Gammaproteobacteria bacterium]